MTDTATRNKALIAPVRAAMYDWTNDGVRAALQTAFSADAEVHLTFPFEDLDGPAALFETAYVPLRDAFPDLERRDTIVIAGSTEEGHDWVGCCGYYTGAFMRPWLDIPPTGKQAAMRFHEFYRVVDGAVVEMQAVWDIPEVMMQADAWPMGPSLGRDWHVPGPATQDGIVPGPYNAVESQASQDQSHDPRIVLADPKLPIEHAEDLIALEHVPPAKCRQDGQDRKQHGHHLAKRGQGWQAIPNTVVQVHHRAAQHGPIRLDAAINLRQ